MADVIDLDAGTRRSGGPETVLLIVDQFEEVFVQPDKAERDAFMAALNRLRGAAGVKLLLTMRADFFNDLINCDLWPVDASQRVELGPLRGDGLRRAIRAPAASVGVFVDEVLVERLIRDAADGPGVLPLLQETMRLLWHDLQFRYLPADVYEQLGEGAASGLARAVGLKADTTLEKLKLPAEKILARRIFLRLTQFGEGRPDTRRQQTMAELQSAADDPALFDRVVRHLADNRLLTLSGGEGQAEKRVDLSHESLMTGWPQFATWLRERREAEQARRRLEDKAGEWVRLGRGEAGLLDQVELAEADRWLAQETAGDLGYSAALVTLTTASRAALERADAEKRAVQERELAQARELAESKTRSAQALAKRNRVLGVALVLAVVAAVVAAFFVQQTNVARQDADNNAAAASTAVAEALARSTEVVARTTEVVAQANAKGTEAAARGTAEAVALARGTEAANQVHAKETSAADAIAAQATAQSEAQRADQERQAAERQALAAAAQAAYYIGEGDQALPLALAAADLNPADPPREILPVLYAAADSYARRSFRALALGRHIFSVDGKSAFLFTNAADARELQQVDLLTGRVLHSYGELLGFDLSPDGKTFLAVDSDGSIKVIDIASGSVLKPFAGLAEGMTDLTFNADGRLALSDASDGTIHLWDVDSGATVKTYDPGRGSIDSFAMSPDGGVLAIVEGTGIWVYHDDASKPVRVFPDEAKQDGSVELRAATFGANRDSVLCVAARGTVLNPDYSVRENAVYKLDVASGESLPSTPRARRRLHLSPMWPQAIRSSRGPAMG